MKNFPVVIMSVVVVAVFGVGGYLVGASGSSSTSEAENVEQKEFRHARAFAFAAARSRSRRVSFSVGVKRGKRMGQDEGTHAGAAAGNHDAHAELAAIEAAEAEAAAEAEEAEEARAEGCHVPLFVDGYCPTPAEIEQENQAEAEGGY